jgi:fatty acid-binding protein DegV
MSRPKSKPKVQPSTPEQIKSLIDGLDRMGQQHLLHLLLSDPLSTVGNYVKAMIAHFMVRVDILEELCGLAPEQIDPEGLRHHKETLKKQGKRRAQQRRAKNTNAVKQARHRVKKRLEKLASTMPIVSVDDAGKITVIPRA